MALPAIVVSDSNPDPAEVISVDATDFDPDAFQRLLLDGVVVQKSCLKSDSDGHYATTIVAPSVPEEATLIAQELVAGDWVTMASTTFVVGDYAPPPPPVTPTVPGPPRSLVATAGDTQVGLDWTFPLDDGGSAVLSYDVYKNGVFLANTLSRFYVSTGLTNGVTYTYYVVAKNAIGDGPPSTPASATPRTAPAGTPPDAAAGELQSRINAATAPGNLVLPFKRWKEAAIIPPSKAGLKLDFDGGWIDGQNVRDKWLTVQADFVHLSNVVMKDALQASGAGSFQRGSLIAHGVSGFQLFQAHLSKGTARGLSIENDVATRIIDVEIDGCPVLGVGGGPHVDLQMYGTGNVDWPARIHDNGRLNVVGGGNTFGNPGGPGNEGGGAKFAVVSGGLVHDYEFDHNYGPGLWFDIACQNVTAYSFSAHHNTMAGFFYEISRLLVAHAFSVYDNGFDNTVDGATMPGDTRTASFGWPAGVLLSSSNDCELYDFVAAWNKVGAGVVYQANRSDREQPARNLYLHDYLSVGEAGWYLVTWNMDGGPNSSSTLFTDLSNRGVSGDYWSDGGDVANFAWLGLKNLAQFNATNGDAGGQYLTLLARNAALAARGVPTAPSHL